MLAPAIIVHGGAGRHVPELAADTERGCAHAAAAGWAVLQQGGSAVDAVVAAVAMLEDDPVFNAGVGSCLTADGRVEMDASLMDGERRHGAGVALLTSVRNPIRLAEMVCRDGRHVLLAGAGAETFARQRHVATIDPDALVTPRQRQRWQQLVAGTQRPDAPVPGGGTVGAVAVDRCARVAAATSTGGMIGKLPGRIGDSAILGAGTFADSAAGAASATGHGEAIILTGVARTAVERLRDGRSPEHVAAEIIRSLSERVPGAVAGLILVDRFGRCAAAHNAESMPQCRYPSA